MISEVNNNINYQWNVYYHYDKSSWSLSGYKKIYEINTTKDFWLLFNNWNKLGGILSKHFFFMKNDVPPIWEDEKNLNGGCWSFKVFENQSNLLWEELCMYAVCNELCPTIESEIVGLSICLKKNNYCVLKIWNTDSNNNSLSLINKNIIKKWGTNIIYIAHITS